VALNVLLLNFDVFFFNSLQILLLETRSTSGL